MKQNGCRNGSSAFTEVSEEKCWKEYGEVPPSIIDYRVGGGKDKCGDNPCPPEFYTKYIPSFLTHRVHRRLKISPEVKLLRQRHQKDLKCNCTPKVWEASKPKTFHLEHIDLPQMRAYQK